MKDMSQTRVSWFIKPGNNPTREFIEKLLSAQDALLVGTKKKLRDNRQRNHLVLQVPDYRFIAELDKHKGDQKLVFQIFSKTEKAKSIRIGIFGRQNKKNKPQGKTRKEASHEKQ